MRVEPNWLSEALCHLDGSHLLREKREVELLVGGRCRIDSRNLLDFSSNNYLDLARDPGVLAAAAEAVEAGLGAGASPLVTGRSPHYRLLEETLAEFEGTPAALLFRDRPVFDADLIGKTLHRRSEQLPHRDGCEAHRILL